MYGTALLLPWAVKWADTTHVPLQNIVELNVGKCHAGAQGQLPVGAATEAPHGHQHVGDSRGARKDSFRMAGIAGGGRLWSTPGAVHSGLQQHHHGKATGLTRPARTAYQGVLSKNQ